MKTLTQLLNEAFGNTFILNEGAVEELPNYFKFLPGNLVNIIKFDYDRIPTTQNADDLAKIINQIKIFRNKTKQISPEILDAFNKLDAAYDKINANYETFMESFEIRCNLCLAFVQIMNAIRGNKLALEFIYAKDIQFYFRINTRKINDSSLCFMNNKIEIKQGFNEFMNIANAYAQKSGLIISHPNKNVVEFKIK